MNHDHRVRQLVTRLLAVALAVTLAFGAVTVPLGATGGPTAENSPREVSAQSRPTRPPRSTTAPAPPTSTRVPTNPTAIPATATAQTAATRRPRSTVGATSTPLATVAAPATRPPTTGGGSSACPTGEEMVMLGLINNFRSQNGVGPLTLSPTLTAAADFHSVDMANRNYFSHDLPGIGTWSQNISNYGYTGGTRAENIAAGYGNAASTVQGWINSPGHRANMLNPNLRAIGIGSAYNAGSQYGTYWTNTFGGTIDSAMSC